jgi:hypothetical protein
MSEQVVEFVDKQRDLPKIRAVLWQVGGVADADLVVVDHRATARGEFGVAQQVVVRGPGAAVQHDERCRAGGEITGDPIPGLPATEVRGAFGGADSHRQTPCRPRDDACLRRLR